MKNRPPNILVFLTDDHGQWASPAYGNSEIIAPSMERLAREGACFDRAHTPNPVCSPARASFWTGTIPSWHGIHDFFQEWGDFQLNHPAIREQETLGERLQAVGYRTGICGKWHCGHPEYPRTGFDTWFTSLRGTNAVFGQQVFTDGENEVSWTGHQAPRLTERALQFMREPQDQPWFLFVGYTDTHTPHKGAPETWAGYYRHNASFRDIPNVPTTEEHGEVNFAHAYARENERESLAQYYAAVSFIDSQIGILMAELESTCQLDNTLIIYTSDHGHMNGHHGLHTKGNATSPQNLLEHSIRVPLLMRWPQGGVPQGWRSKAFVDHCDAHATILEVAQAERAPKQGGAGTSLQRLWKDPGFRWRSFQCCEYGNARMLRNERYKLIIRYPGQYHHHDNELYDLIVDPEEHHNLYTLPDFQGLVTEMEKKLEEWFSEREHPDPSRRLALESPQHSWYEPWRKDMRKL